MIVIGIDEAGYGPMLGPLVVAGAAFRIDDASRPDEFPRRLDAALRAAKVRIGDSKRLFGATRDLATLEAPVLAFLAMSGRAVGGVDELLAAVEVDPAVRGAAPWYADVPSAFPLCADSADVADAASRLRGALDAAGVTFLGLAADVVTERRFNDALAAGNKADLLFCVSAGVHDRLVARRGAGECSTAVFDRQGGRRFYAPSLQRRWPQALACPIVETPTRSDYRMHFDGATADASFRVEADHECPHVGLASMLAKYLRETFMTMFNGHFAPRCPGVAPTAGYVEDGRRWLAETRASRERAGPPDSDLVRRR